MPHPRQDTGREGRTGVLSGGPVTNPPPGCSAHSAPRPPPSPDTTGSPPSPRAQAHEPVEDVRLVPGQQGAGGLPLDEVGQQVLLRVRRPCEAVDEVLHVLGSGGSARAAAPRRAASVRGAAGGAPGPFGGNPL